MLRILLRKFYGALYIQEALPRAPCHRVCQAILSHTPRHPLAWLCCALVCLGLSLWYYDTSYGKYTLPPTNLCYPFVYIGLYLGIALALPWHTAHALPMLYYNTLSPPKCLTHYNTRAHYTFVYHYLSFLAIVFLFCWCHV